MYCSKPKYRSIHVSFQCFICENVACPCWTGGHCLHWSMYGTCKCFTTLQHVHWYTVYWGEGLMSFCSPAVSADAYIVTKNAHVLLYPHPPMLTHAGKVAFPIKLHYITWLRPSVPLSWADVPDVAFPSLFDPCLTAAMLHRVTASLLPPNWDYESFVWLGIREEVRVLMSPLMNIVLCRHFTDWYRYNNEDEDLCEIETLLN